jgi:hypothetical protein
MIAANKNLLQATLTQGVLGIQTNLVDLYTNNLLALATQASLIAGFSFSAVVLTTTTDNLQNFALSYFYYSCFTVSFISALFVLSQSTIVVNFGPTMALKGNSQDAVKIAAIQMRKQLEVIYTASVLSITSLFVGACLITWVIYPFGVAVITSFLYVAGMYFIYKHGSTVYYMFVAAEGDIFNSNGTTQAKEKDDSKQGGFLYNLVGKKDNDSSANASDSNSIALRNNDALIEGIRFRSRGTLWKRLPIEEGGTFFQCYANLEKGKLDFYRSKEDYSENNNPINKKAIKLWEVECETDPRKFSKKVTALGNLAKSALVGSEDFTISDLMKYQKKYDLKYASKNFKFALIPKVSSELVVSEVHEFLAQDEESFIAWTSAFNTVINAYKAIANAPSVEDTMRTGIADVETVVQAANNNEK